MANRSCIGSVALAGLMLVASQSPARGQEAGSPAAGGAQERVAAITKVCLARDPKSAGVAKAALKDENAMVRRLAIYSLERMGDAGAGGDIIPMLKDKDLWVRRTAAVALGKLGSRQGAGPLAAVAASDPEIYVRYDAFLALGRLADTETQAQVMAAAKDQRLWHEMYGFEQASIVELISEPWFVDPGARSFLAKLLKKADEPHPELDTLPAARRASSVRTVTDAAAAALALRYSDPAGEEDLLQVVVRRDDDFLLQKAARALAVLKSKRAVPALVAALEGNARGEKWLNTSRGILEALGAIGTPEAAAALEKVLGHEDYRMRRTAAEALAKIDGRKREYAPEGPAAKIPAMPEAKLAAPGGKHPPQFIILGVDDCANVEGVESLVNICETLRDNGAKAVFTMWLAPMAGSCKNNDIEKRKVLYQYLFDMGNEIAHHTLHHNPGGQNWASLPHEVQIEEIEGCTKWYQDNIQGFTRPFTHKGGGGGQGSAADVAFTRQLMERQNFIYRGRRGGHPNEFVWPSADEVPMLIPTSALDANAGPVHETITDPIVSDYPGRFDYSIEDGAAMWKANLDYRYAHPLRPPLVINACHDWGLRDVVDKVGQVSHRNEGRILKAFLVDVLVKNKDKYPDTYCITFRQLMEYVRTGGDLKQTLAIGNGQDRRNPAKPSIQ